ncbi:hypothetical protein [Nitratireductor sp. ZSWI3]|uniref:hypothetical protein n=1 Tax=Nitratireductor sp. ZSWI3 TaxID=2966359 RepID=UPI002150588D|nr:hypothetical protein [Nitratireductor sp. ZSWI3]MCR4266913.1 hypothetical protein [Nitratireductor sp. ZSWI3]
MLALVALALLAGSVWYGGRVPGSAPLGETIDAFRKICIETMVYKLEPEGAGRGEALQELGLTHEASGVPEMRSNASGSLWAKGRARDDGGYECAIAYRNRFDTLPLQRLYFAWKMDVSGMTKVDQSTLGFSGPNYEAWPVDVYAFKDDLFTYYLTFEPPNEDTYYQLRLVKVPE